MQDLHHFSVGAVADHLGMKRCSFCTGQGGREVDHRRCEGGITWCECPCGTGEIMDPLAVPRPRDAV